MTPMLEGFDRAGPTPRGVIGLAIEVREPRVEALDIDIVEKIDEGLEPSIDPVGRGRNESDEPPPIRLGMNPSASPP